MKSFKEYLKQLAEDKLITKEDEGAAAPMGDVSAPSGDASASGDVQTSQAKTDGGLSTTDVLGKCDHKHDGFFGPGCFHRPFPIFSYPISRLKKKKRKYIKVLDLTESDEFGKFGPIAQSIIEREMESANNYVSNLGMRCHYEKDYDFSGKKSDWVGAVDFENQDEANDFGIAFNLPAIYGFLEENSLENDETELKCQIRATLYHELGHAIIRKLKDDEAYDFEMTENEEEKLVEEFANYMLREYTGKTTSRLNSFIEDVFGENKKQEISTLKEMINVSDNRLLSENQIVDIMFDESKIERITPDIDLSENNSIFYDDGDVLSGKISFYKLKDDKNKIIGRIISENCVYWFSPTSDDITKMKQQKMFK